MTDIQQVLDELWRDAKTTLPRGDGKKYTIVFSRHHGFLDVTMRDDGSESIGFITLKYESDGTYSIVNDTKTNPHLGFVNTPGHGIEVIEKYRKRGIGKALLSIGIGLAQRDWRFNMAEEGRFTVVASDVTDSGLGCYQNFGFIVRGGNGGHPVPLP